MFDLKNLSYEYFEAFLKDRKTARRQVISAAVRSRGFFRQMARVLEDMSAARSAEKKEGLKKTR